MDERRFSRRENQATRPTPAKAPGVHTPSVKGTTFVFLVDEAKRLVSEGRVPERALDNLPPATCELTTQRVLQAAWYPVSHYEALGEWLAEQHRGDRVEYLRELGARDFERLQHGTTYRQVAYAQGIQKRRDIATKLRDARLITSMMAAVFNFSRWAPQPDPLSPQHIVIEVTEADAIPECFRFLTEGFQTAMNRSINPKARAARSERPSADRILFRTNGPRPTDT